MKAQRAQATKVALGMLLLALLLSTCSAAPVARRTLAPEQALDEASSTVLQTGGTTVSQWSNAGNVNQVFNCYAAPLLTLMRYGRTNNGAYRGGIAFAKAAGTNAQTYKCWDDGFIDTEIGATKNCDIKPGDVRNLQADFFSWLGTVAPNGVVTYVADNDARWVLLGGDNWYDLPTGKAYTIRYGSTSGGFIYGNHAGRFRCNNYWFGDPAYGVSGKQCWYWSTPNNYMTPTDTAVQKTEKGQFVDCALQGQTCVVATDLRPYWVRIYGWRSGVYTAAFRMVDTDQFVCSSQAFGYDVSSQQFSDAIGNTPFRCGWFKPDSFHYAPVGRWSNVVSGPQGAALSYTLSYGVDSSMTTVDSKEYSHSVTTTVEAGFIFASVSVSYSFAYSTSHSIENSASVSVGRECAVSTCVGAPGWITNVMWAWKLDIGETCSWGDAGCEATVNTCNFWCTSSINKPPLCPPGACKDLECQTCNPWT